MRIDVTRTLLVCISICFQAVFWRGTCCQADDALYRRCLTSWTEYENIQLLGTATRYSGDEVAEKFSFTVNLGAGIQGQPGPMEIGIRIPNPGEPHIDSDEIFSRALAKSGDACVEFKREFISKKPVSARESWVQLHAAQRDVAPFSMISKAVFAGLDSFEPRGNAGVIATIMKKCDLKVLGKEKFLGFDVLRVALTIDLGILQSGEMSPPLIIESLIALEPTFQVLKFVSVDGGPAGSLEQPGGREQYLGRTVESAKVMGKWLICNRIRLFDQYGHWIIEITDVRDLPSDYVGLWDYNKITGALFTGEIEKATRKGSPRLAFKHTKEGTYIPYTQQEQEKIRQFLISHTQPIERKIAWTSVLFWIVNATAIMVLSYIGYRRYRFG